MLPKFTIIPTDAGGYAVYMNNDELRGVTAVHIYMAVNETPKVQLEFLAREITANLQEAEVQNIEDDRTD